MKPTTWRKTSVSAAVSAALCSFMTAPAGAQEAIEEVVVTGIRGSLRQSMDVKRDSTGVVDAISAEDIGQFPDTNLAESLQRITGVSINRVNGEGSEVTVRGFGGGFNLVTLNGLQLPAANVSAITGNSDQAGSTGSSRSFDFSNLASEGVRGIQVYKTGNAAVPSGGVGATINIQTIRPLESGNQAIIAAKAVHDESGDESITPEIGGLWSWANDGGTFGMSLFGSYQERSSGSRGVNVSVYSFFDYSPSLSFLQNSQIVNPPEDGALMALPANIGMNYAQIERERANAMLTMQFAPSDDTMITADVLYTSNTLSQDNLVPGIWYSRQFSYIEFDGSPITATPLRLIEDIAPPDGRGKDYFFASWDNDTKDEMLTVALSLDHQIDDNWSLFGNAATSTVESGGNGADGKSTWRFNVAAAGAGWQAADYSGGVPTATIGVVENTGPAGGNGNGILDPEDIATQTLTTVASDQETDISQLNLGGAWDNNDGVHVDFGVGYMTTEMAQTNLNTTDFLGGWGVGVRDIPDPNNTLNQVDVPSQFNDLNFAGYPDAENIAPPGYYLTTLGAESFQLLDPRAFAQSQDGYVRGDGSQFDFDNLTQTGLADNLIEEEIFSIYLSAAFEGELGGYDTQTVVGVRYESTDVTSTTQQSIPLSVTWTSDNDFRQNFSSDLQGVKETHSYTNVLPNIDFAVDVTENWKARASVSQTISRPSYNFMFITTDVNTPPTLTSLGGISTASKGSARLDPLESTNFDLSVEWYYNDSSYASIGYYTKAVNNFVGTATVDQTLFDLRDVTSGAPGTLSGDAADELTNAGWIVNEQNMFTMAAILANPQDFPNGAGDYLDPSEAGGAQLALDIIAQYDLDAAATDPFFVYSTAQPVNNQTANIDGWEFAWQHFFGDSGFGMQLNATIVDGDIEYDVAADPSVAQFALLGLSDSANLVGIYEKGNWSARIAYNWRDSFLSDTTYQGQAGLPSYIDEFNQLDAKLSWFATDNFTLSVEGINMTGEGQVVFSRTRQMQWWNGEADPRWVLSARYNFD